LESNKKALSKSCSRSNSREDTKGGAHRQHDEEESKNSQLMKEADDDSLFGTVGVM